jgi:hypothetical protein
MGRSENGGTKAERKAKMKSELKRGQQHPLKRRSKSMLLLVVAAPAGVASF